MLKRENTYRFSISPASPTSTPISHFIGLVSLRLAQRAASLGDDRLLLASVSGPALLGFGLLLSRVHSGFGQWVVFLLADKCKRSLQPDPLRCDSQRQRHLHRVRGGRSSVEMRRRGRDGR